MASKKDRPSVLDLIILVAATAAGLALTRSLPAYIGLDTRTSIDREIYADRCGGWGTSGWSLNTRGKSFTPRGQPFHRRPSYWFTHLPYWAGPCLVSGTMASMAMGFRGPRPRLRRIARGPSMAAGLALILASAIDAIRCLQLLIADGVTNPPPIESREAEWTYFWISLPRLAGCSVAMWWLALAFCGRWSAELTAGGKLGRAIGWSWIAMALSSEIGVWCFGLNY